MSADSLSMFAPLGFDRSLLSNVVELLQAGRLTLAVAESSAGGHVCQVLTSVPGSSRVVLGGIVAYSNDSKIRLLGVSPDLLETSGAVSSEVCLAMAQGARRLFMASIGLAETGIAGPDGGTPLKPVGLCYVGATGPAGDLWETRVLAAERGPFRREATAFALELLARYLRPGG